MSTQRGNFKRTRAQKHKNSHAFKNDMHDKSNQQKMLNGLNIADVCLSCKGVLEWKIKYKKYKPLSQPKTCTNCQQRNIRRAYHVLCRDCARAARVCAKCLKSADEVEIVPEQPSELEQIKLKAELTRLVKVLPERKRRAFWRYMEKGKQIELPEANEAEAEESDAEKAGESDNDDDEAKPQEEKNIIPFTRDELLEKIEQLRLSCKDDDEDEFDEDSEASSDEEEN